MSPEIEIKRHMVFDGFHLDDNDIYDSFFTILKSVKEHFGDRPMRDYLLYAIYKHVSDYFGNWQVTPNNEQNNQAFYQEKSIYTGEDDTESISIAELKGKGISVCAERAAVAENLLALAGYKTRYVVGKVRRENEESAGMHAYNIIKSSRGYFLVDVTNPIVLYKNGQPISAAPAVHPLTEDRFEELMSKKPISVEHTDGEEDDHGERTLKPETWVYE